MERRNGYQHVLSVTQKASRKASGNREACSVMESDIGGASWKSRCGMRHGKHDPSSVTEKSLMESVVEGVTS